MKFIYMEVDNGDFEYFLILIKYIFLSYKINSVIETDN